MAWYQSGERENQADAKYAMVGQIVTVVGKVGKVGKVGRFVGGGSRANAIIHPARTNDGTLLGIVPGRRCA